LASDEQRTYWQQELGDFVFTKIERLPHEITVTPDAKMKSRTQPLAEETVAGLNRLAQLSSAPIRDVLLAAHCFVTSKISGVDEIVTGMVVNGRPEQAQAEQVIGLHLNTLPYRIALPNGNWIDLVRTVFETGSRSFPYRRYPMAQILQDLGGQKLFEVAFNYINFHVYDTLKGNNDLEVLSMEDSIFNDFPLVVNFILSGDGQLSLYLEWDATEFGDEQIELIFGYFERTLNAMVSEPTAPLQTCSVLSESQKQQLLVEWNETHSEYTDSLCFHQLFEQQVARTPDAIAVVFEEQKLTYRELNEQANKLAHALQKRGIQPDRLVAIYLEHSPELIVGLLAILKAGGAYLPLDPVYPLDRITYALEDAQVPVLLTVERLAAKLPELQTQVICLDADAAVIAQESEQNPVTEVTFDNLAYVIYTSGSTGRPKGTLIEHRGMMNYIQWAAQAYEVAAGDGVPVHSSIAFDLTVTAIFPPLMTGKQIVLVPQSVGVDSLLQVLEQYQNFSYIKLTPAHLKLLNQQVSPARAKNLFRKIIIGGEALYADDVAFWLDNAPDTELINEYGPTETVVGSIVHTVSRDLEVSGSIRIGRPIANTQIYLLDNHQQLVPVGATGEIYIGGAGVARGYLNLPELTAERFVAHPFTDKQDERLYRTGDLARYLANGDLEYLGRIDHQVKLRGFRIELGEIEAVLAQHPAVREAVVVVREDVPGDQRLVAYVVAKDEALASTELRGYVANHLPEYMVPSAYMLLETIPLTANGKVDRKALPVPDATRHAESEFVAPRTETEEQLAEIWQEVLRVEQVGIYDNFFELGGHSLMATQLLSRMRNAFEVELSLRLLFEMPTIASIAAHIETATMTNGQMKIVRRAPVINEQGQRIY
ncbi:MAG: non-ribosomal peptide synthetase, partial [Tumebacillaceae bacterium]